jgi:iron(III) transport system substrate-binding protein
MRSLPIWLLGALLLLWVPACSPRPEPQTASPASPAATPGAGSPAAGGEGDKVVVYTPFPEITARELAAAFEKKTGIHVEQVLEGTTKVFARIRAEKNYPRCDVWYGGGGMIPFMVAAQENLLEPYPSPRGGPQKRGNLILRDADWRWQGMAVIALGYAYNPQVLKESDIPRQWSDLADPRWKGKIEMWDPAESGTAMLFLEAALLRAIQDGKGEEAGWEYLTSFYKNLKRYTVEGKPAFNVARGETLIGIHFEHQVLEFLAEQSGGSQQVANVTQNIRWYLPDRSPVIVDPIALVRGAPHPENGRKFIDFVLSEEGQRIVNRFCYTMNPHLPPPRGLDMTLEQVLKKAMPLDPEWMSQKYDAVRKRWQDEVEAVPKD